MNYDFESHNEVDAVQLTPEDIAKIEKEVEDIQEVTRLQTLREQ